MIFGDQRPTPYDLNFHIGRTPVSVHPFFWLTSAMLGWDFFHAGFGYLLTWIACCFFSVLLHELGHIWAGRVLGQRYGHIVLGAFGGAAYDVSDLPKRWERIAVTFAGPGIQIAFWGILSLLEHSIYAAVRRDWLFQVVFVVQILLSINLYWALLNLLPIWPMDGGRITRELCVAGSPEKGVETSLYISLICSGVLAVHCFMAQNGTGLIPQLYWIGGTFLGIFFAMDFVMSFQLLQAEREHHRSWSDDDLPWER